MRAVKPNELASGLAHCDNTVVNSRYTAVTFLPLNLYEQFRRPLNLYFLFVSCLQFVSIIAPVNPLSTLLPLLLAFSLTAAKEGYDDLKRHRQDALYNARKYSVLRLGRWQSVESCEIRVGDVILLQRDQEIPCDVVCVGCPDDCGNTVYIRTDNLDGEIDLKARDVVTVPLLFGSGSMQERHDKGENLRPMIPLSATPDEIRAACSPVTFTCPPPSAAVDAFDANLQVVDGANSASLSLTHHHLLPQSCFLKNVDAILTVAVYTGNETKCGMNKKAAPPVKWAKVDQQVSNYSKIIFVCQMISAVTFGIVGYSKNHNLGDSHWYVGQGPSIDTDSLAPIIYPLRFFLLTSVMIPISFKFVVDMSKYYMALVLEWDTQMYDDERQEPVRVKNSSIVEDLGQVEYVLSDKTGTMTQNVMKLKACSVGGTRVDVRDALLDDFNAPASLQQNDWADFLTYLSLCNTVEVERPKPTNPNPRIPTYSGVSPDEEALCTFAATRGVVLEARTKTSMNLRCWGKQKTYTIHEVFAFSSERKCMSVLVEGNDNVLTLVTKGADDRIFSMLAPQHDDSKLRLREAVVGQIRDFAATGLRTLVIGKKNVTPAELTDFQNKYRQVRLLTEGRQQAMWTLQKELECGLDLVGATAIEDQLQEGVSETIRDLITANVRVWMLTGDKIETAQQIALLCGIATPQDTWIDVYGDGWEEKIVSQSRLADDPRLSPGSSEGSDVVLLKKVPREGAQLTGQVLLVEGGKTIDTILASDTLRQQFLTVALKCKSVVCARVTPVQKALVTALVRQQNKVTLAIGDGGNDVAMIQEAHVGVGILGKEGQQAARAADFSITKFRFLKTLLFVHGHLSYRRTCYVVQYSFYKSMLISFVQLVFNMFNTLVSGVSFWNSFFLTAWNGAYTLPQTLLYCLDRSVPRECLMMQPALYRLSQVGYGQTPITFVTYVLRGLSQALFLLYFMYRFFGDAYSHSYNASTESTDVTFTVSYTCLILLQAVTVILESHSLTWLNVAAIAVMPIVYAVVNIAYSGIPTLEYYGVWSMSTTFPLVLAAIIVCAILFFPHMLFQAIKVNAWPNAVELYRSRWVHKCIAFRAAEARSKRPSRRLSLREQVSRLLSLLWAQWVTPEDDVLRKSINSSSDANI